MRLAALAEDHATGEVVQGSTDAADVLRTLIVALGGFCAAAAVVLAVWYLLPLVRKNTEKPLATGLFGFILLSYSGLAGLTTDHIYDHLVSNSASAWLLWSALGFFAIGVVSLLFLIAIRVDRKTAR